MSSNVGLSTPRGSGTSGYVQRNISALKPRDHSHPYSRDFDKIEKHRQRQPNQEILDHDRKRNVELKCFELRDQLEDEGIDEDEIEERVDDLRKQLMREFDTSRPGNARGLKVHQVHELAQAKMAENEKLQRALNIPADYEEGSHWRRQEEEKLRRQQEFAEKDRIATLAATTADKEGGADTSRRRRDRRSRTRSSGSRSRSSSSNGRPRSVSDVSMSDGDNERQSRRSRRRSYDRSRSRENSRRRDRRRNSGREDRDESRGGQDHKRGDNRTDHKREYSKDRSRSRERGSKRGRDSSRDRDKGRTDKRDSRSRSRGRRSRSYSWSSSSAGSYSD